MGKYIGIAGSIASIVSLFVSSDKGIFNIVALVIGAISVILSVCLEIKDYVENKPLKFDRQGNIDYMRQIISNEGKIIVFAGELSWVNNDEIRKALKEKGKDLTLCVKNTAPNLEDYKKAGVKVYTYNDGDFSPKARFTIIRPNDTNEKIAIASVLDNHKTEKRYVYEITRDNSDYKSEWIIGAANDIVNLIKTIESEKQNVH